MATKDIVLLNLTSSKLEAQQSADTARLRGNSDLLLSVEDASYNQILTVNTNTSVIGTPAITASGEVTMSSTGSFGRVNATYFRGDGSNLTYTLTADHVSSSAQLGANISGSWQGDLSQSEFTYPEYLAGEESGLTFVSGGLTGSVVSTASFGRIEVDRLTGDASQMTNLIPNLTISSSVQISKAISGSWQTQLSSSNMLEISGGISASNWDFSASMKVHGNNQQIVLSEAVTYDDFSAIFWIHQHSPSGSMDNNEQVNLLGGDSANDYFAIWRYQNNHRPDYARFDGGFKARTSTGAGVIVDKWNQWDCYGISVQRSGSTSFYYNGEQIVSAISNETHAYLADFDSAMALDAHDDKNVANRIDFAEIAIWNSALSSSIFKQHFNGGSPMNLHDLPLQSGSLRTWLRSDSASYDGGGSWSIYDWSGNSNTGSLKNSTPDAQIAGIPGTGVISQSDYNTVPGQKVSFGHVKTNTFTGDGSQLKNVIHKQVISSSDAFVERTIMGMDTGSGVNLISGSWQNELSSSSDLFVSGGISGSTLHPEFSASWYGNSGNTNDWNMLFEPSGTHEHWPLSASDSWTIGGWYKADPLQGTYTRETVWSMNLQSDRTLYIWTNRQAAQDGQMLTVSDADNVGGQHVLTFTSASGNPEHGGDPNDVTTNRISKFIDGQWHQFFITAEGHTGSLFLDGEFITSSRINSYYHTMGGMSMSLSGKNMGPDQGHWYWTNRGTYGTWACWNHALSASAAPALYNQRLSKDFTVNEGGYQQASDLVGWWKFGESSSFGQHGKSGWHVADSAGNNFTGSQQNSQESDGNAITSSEVGPRAVPRFTSTFGRVEATSITGDGTFYEFDNSYQGVVRRGLTNVLDDDIISASGQYTSEITGSWQGEFSSSAQLFISGGVSSSAAYGSYYSSYAFEHNQGANDFWDGTPGGAGTYWDFSDEGNQISFGTWFTMDDIPSDRKAYILDAGDVFLRINDTEDSFRAGAGGISNVYQYNLDEALTRHKWHHVFVTYNKAKVKIYTDGKETATGNATGNTVMSRFKIAGSNTWDGKLSDFLVYNKGITAEAVSQLYNNGMGGNPLEISQSALKAWYKMGEGATFAGSTWSQPDALGLAPTITSSLSLGAAARVDGHPAGGHRFSRVDANVLVGDGSELKGIFTQGELSGSNQIEGDITGSTHWGFTLTSSLDTLVGYVDQDVSPTSSPTFGHTIVSGSVKAAKMVVTSSVSHYSSSKGSGSVVFGDSTEDLHSFTGSLQVGRVYQNKRSISFTGIKGYVQIPFTEPDIGLQDQTISVWFKSSDVSSFFFLDTRDGNDDGIRFLFESDDKIRLSVRAVDISSDSAVTSDQNQWHHYVATIDLDGNGIIYRDGALLKSGDISSAGAIATSVDLTVGRRAYSADDFGTGNVAELAIWDRVLTANQVGDLFNVTGSGYFHGKPLHIEPDSLRALYLMGDGAIQSGSAGWIIPDISKNGNDARTIDMNELSASYDTFYSGSESVHIQPLEIPQGHVKGEHYTSPNQRGIVGGGFAPGGTSNIIDHVTINTAGNATDFGDLVTARKYSAAASNGSSDRGVFAGGNRNTPPATFDSIEFVTISTTGDAQDFGNILSENVGLAGTDNGPYNRAVFFGGSAPGTVDTIQYLTTSTLGNTKDFGNLTGAVTYTSALSNKTNQRGVRAGGYPSINTMDYVTITTPSDAVDFGDLTAARYHLAATSNAQYERGIIMGGQSSNVIDFITISSIGNATDFGDLITSTFTEMPAATSNATDQRGIITGTYPASNTIEFVTISSLGNSTDFGDLTQKRYGPAGTSNSTIGAFGQTTGSVANWTGDGSGLTFSSNPATASFSDPRKTFRAHGDVDPVFGLNSNSGVGAATGSLIIPSGITGQFGMRHNDNPVFGRRSGESGSRFAHMGRVDYGPGEALLRHNIQAENSAFEAQFTSASATTWRSSSISASYADETTGTASLFSSETFGKVKGAHLSGSSAGPAPQHGSLTHQFTEAWDGLNWIVFATGSAQVGERGVIITSDTVDDIEYVTISKPGNAATFGNQTNASKSKRSATSNGTNGRGLFGGGAAPGNINVIDFVTISSTGNATDHGDLTVARGTLGAISNGTNDRAVFGGGTDRMDYVAISTLGNAAIFGTLQALTIGTEGTSNGTNERGIFGGTYPAANATIEFITIFNVSDAADFGDLVVAAGTRASFSNDLNDRGIFAGGTAPAAKADIDFVTISTVGNAADFGDLMEVNAAPGGLSSGTNDRGIVFGDSPAQKTIQFITISTPGNATDFGRLREAKADAKGTSNSAK